MSNLTAQLTAQFNETLPAEYDENWVNTLLTDSDKQNSRPKPTPCPSQELISDIIKIEAEIRAKNPGHALQRKRSKINATPITSKNKPRTSAIEKQILAHSVRSNMQTPTVKGSDKSNHNKRRRLGLFKKH
jgi:hypothetical protein